MKFNLKNRPKGFTEDQPNPFDENFKVLKNDYEAWFEGFEKELRRIVKEYEPWGECAEGYIATFIRKDILGET